jgi:hypothetical protein
VQPSHTASARSPRYHAEGRNSLRSTDEIAAGTAVTGGNRALHGPQGVQGFLIDDTGIEWNGQVGLLGHGCAQRSWKDAAMAE